MNERRPPDLTGANGMPEDTDADVNTRENEAPQGLAALTLTPEEVEEAAKGLAQLDWGDGLTRVEIREQYPELPDAIFMHLPAVRQYTSAHEVLHDAGFASERAEGEWLDEDDVPVEESLAEGGPPAWGPDPLLSDNGIEESGSATDTEGLIEDE